MAWNFYNSKGSRIESASKVLKVYSASSGPSSQDITVVGFAAITGLSIVLTPVNSFSKFLLQANVNHQTTYVQSMTFFKDGTNLFSHSSNSRAAGSHSTYYRNEPSTGLMSQMNMAWVDSPATASAITYDVRAGSGWAGTAHTLRINQRGSDDMASLSFFMITEFIQ